MNKNGVLTFLYTTAVLVLIVASGCEVSVSNPKQHVGQKCPAVDNASNQQFETAITKEIHEKDYTCLEASLESGKALGPDSTVVGTLRVLLQDNSIPDAAKVAAVSYLLFASGPQGVTARDENIGAIRNIAQTGEDDIRAIAISVLGTRKSNEDVDIFSAGVRSGDEAILAYSAFALIDNCSARAQGALRDALTSAPMRDYLRKYAGKESISSVIRSRCPSVADALPHRR
jgi:hypothetical protein